MKKQAQDLDRGDLLDLEDDRYADPEGDTPILQFQKAVVVDVVRETRGCVRVETNHVTFGCPPNHVLNAAPLAEA